MPLLFEHEFIGMIFGFFDQGAQSVIINNRTTNVELLEYWAMGGGWKVEDGDIWLLYIPKHHFRGSIEFGDKLEVVADTPEKGSDEEQDVFLDTPERNLACECKIQLGIYQDKDGHLFFFRMNRNVEVDDISEYTTSPRSYNYPPSFSNEGSDLDIDYDSIGEIDTNSCVYDSIAEIDTNSCVYDSIAEIDTYSCSSYTGDYNISSTPGVSRFDGSSATCSFSNATTGELFDSPGVVGFGGNLSVSSSSITTPSAFSFGASLSSNATPSVFSGSCVASSCSKAIASVFSFSGNSIASSPSSATPSVTSFNANYVTSSSSNGNPNVFSFGGRSTASLYSNAAPSIFSFNGNSIASSSSITIPSVLSFSASSIASSCSKATASAFSFSGNSITSSASNVMSSVYSFNGNSIASSSCNAPLYSNATRSVFSFSGNSTTSSSSSTTTTPTALFSFGGGSIASLSNNVSFGGGSIVSLSNNATPGAFSFTANSIASMFSNTTPPACIYSFCANSTARICSVYSAGAGGSFGSTTPHALSSSSPLSTDFTFGASRGPGFAFGSASSTSNCNSRSALGNSVSTIGPRNGNNGSTDMEDSMVESSATTAEASAVSCCFPFSHFLSFLFNTCFSNPFQSGAGGQHNLSTQQNSSAFQASHNLEIGDGDGDGRNFSLGSGGHSKSSLKIATLRRTAATEARGVDLCSSHVCSLCCCDVVPSSFVADLRGREAAAAMGSYGGK
nr:nuclear pore complex protein NUP1 isoform X3 [Ipomoea batatas]